jgi:hypothetical protein
LAETLPMDARACRQYAEEMRKRYARASRGERTRLLDEFVAMTGYHRKYAIALLGGEPVPRRRPPGRRSRVTAEAVAGLVKIWRAMDYPWSARLVAMLPAWMPHAKAHFALSDEVEHSLLSLSARTIDRALKPHRTELKRKIYGRTKPGTLLKHQIPVRTERWDTNEVGWCETDTVAHCGESGEGEFAFSVNVTDIASTWTETRAVLGKGKRFVVAALDEMRRSLPLRSAASTPTPDRSLLTFTATIGASSTNCNSRAGAPITKTITPTSSKRTGRTCAKFSAGSA